MPFATAVFYCVCVEMYSIVSWQAVLQGAHVASPEYAMIRSDKQKKYRVAWVECYASSQRNPPSECPVGVARRLLIVEKQKGTYVLRNYRHFKKAPER